jgi:class 3 adenylate cyclase/tetratricopeptide (TPR) repeat protein
VTEERRLVTIVFADVVGSTTLGEQLDAEDIRAMLAAYYAIAKDVVTAYGGTLEKFIGDAVMGVFGLPYAHGDDAERALSASLELRDRVRGDPNLADLKLRFGICSGEVVATREPGADFLVTGDAVNVAARLQQSAEPWAIVASERTVAAISSAFELGPRIEIAAKGKGAAIASREVRSKLALRMGVGRPNATMRGREDELDQLALIGRRAFRNQRPAFVTIIAPAGTGKSRLLEEFLTRELPSIAPITLTALAQCLPYGNQLTYWPLRQVLFRLVGVPEDAGASDIRERVAGWLDDPRFADLLATSIGYGLGEAPDRADVFAAWRFALEKASHAHPLVLVFEDLHWSSESLLDLVDFVMQAHGDAPILMLALSRPELLDRRPNWGGGRRNFSNLFLEPLADKDMRGLVRDLLRDGAEKTIDAVVAHAGGNPFYAEELVRSITSGGDIGALPDTVQASIQARLDLLPSDERRLLQLGSIFGRTFRLSGVLALSPGLQSVIEALTESLLRHDMARRDDDDRLTFAHILIRDVAYQTLTRADRARLHAGAGAWLESRAQGRESAVAELIAFHYREAISLLGRQQRLAGFDVGDIKTKAVRWLARAGDAAGAAGAYLEASRHFRAAVDIAADDQLPELYERLGDVEQLTQGSIEAYSKALALVRRAGRPAVDELRVLGGLLTCVLRWAEGVGRFPLATVDQLLSDGRALARRVDDARSLAKFHAAMGFYSFHVGREGGNVTPEMISEGEASARRAADLAESVRDWNTWSGALDGIGASSMERHDWAAAREVAQHRIDRQSHLSVLERMDAHHVANWNSFNLGDLGRAEIIARQAMSLLDYAQNPSLILALIGDLMYTLLLKGGWDEVLQLGDQALRVWNDSQKAIGPGRIAFIAGLDVCRARRDFMHGSQFADALIQMTKDHPTASGFRAYAESDKSPLESELLALIKVGFTRADLLERGVSVLNDHRHSIAPPTLEAVRVHVKHLEIPLLTAQVRRAQGDFEVAATIFADAGAKPYEARARIEKALADGLQPDSGAVDSLRSLGDIEYLESRQLGA